PNPEVGTWRDHLVWDEAASIQKPGSSSDPLAKLAISHYRLLEAFRGASLIEVRLETGKQNQIRIQAGLRGHTLVGETRYVFGVELSSTITFGRQALHAYQLAFRHPLSGRPLRFEAHIPEDMRGLLSRLRRREDDASSSRARPSSGNV
ncbi:MAG: hypothetical protein LC791_11435, partial [Acidobacteria bacterium]|nr:hypothetical protein [Acidobacteriota bacterium]